MVIQINGAKERYPTLPLGEIGIFSDADKEYRVRAIFPMLTPDSRVEYIYSWHSVHSVRIPAPARLSEQDKVNVKIAQELAFLVRDHVRFVEPEIFKLREQWHNINKLLSLVATSEVYANHQEIYERALRQVEGLLDKAEELQLIYVRSIREILIGRQIAAYNPELLPDSSVVIDSKYQQVRDEYQRMKDVATAHAELLRSRQI
ncbi:MAG: hypothetical protein WBA10_16125 [Elainellaceae cyanobacterium]